MEYEGLILDKEAGVAILTLNRPQRLNAISTSMSNSIKNALNDVGGDNNVKVLIITGAGRAFCAGADIGDFLPVLGNMSEDELNKEMSALTLSIHNLSKPTIAAIALLCDIRIGSEQANFASGYIRMGLTPDVGITYSLPRLVGTAKAMEFMITGDIIDAAEACRIGMLNKVVAEEDLITTARDMADRIAIGPSVAIELTKQIVRKGIQNSLEEQVELEASTFYTCLRTEDLKEGANAFLDKRQPEFKGK
ncbi:enoyl-CoA hydratase/isomerase family protein [Chloroflexota bacterium]